MIVAFARILLVLVVAGLTHLTSVLAMPWLAPKAGYMRLVPLAKGNEMTLLPARDLQQAIPFWDPAVAAAACRYVLDTGPVRIRAAVGGSSMAVLFLRKGVGVFQSYSDRAATQGILEMVIATPEQMRQITALDADDEPVQEIRVLSEDDTGLVLVKAVVPTASQRADVEALVGAATCEAESLER
ncbi:MAG TPA: hypothetical protein PK812_12945 [Beijerinckiaceae bacterium]|nr:hypothetical protein [Beijerinckiaceae bacterium]